MNPYFVLHEIRRVLKPRGRFVCSIPNPWTGHPYLYPGLFEYRNFRRFLQQSGFAIQRVEPWQWAPRETILPRSLQRFSAMRSRLVAGSIRRVIENSYRKLGAFPWFCYWLWTFECIYVGERDEGVFEAMALKTRPSSSPDVSREF